jgi:hypothetical protein
MAWHGFDGPEYLMHRLSRLLGGACVGDAELFSLCRALCEEDVQGTSSSVRDAAGEEGQAIMPQGAMKESGLSSSDAYLARKAGQLSEPCRHVGFLSMCHQKLL